MLLSKLLYSHGIMIKVAQHKLNVTRAYTHEANIINDSNYKQPRNGELWTQKLNCHLVRTQSLNVLPLKPEVGQ